MSNTMIKKMPKYESYKDSCEQWIGDIPAHWEVYRLKSAVYECSNGIWGSDPNGRDEIVVLRVADFDDHKLKISDEKLTYRSIPAKEHQGRLLKNGDLLIEKSGGGDKTLVGRVVLFDKQYPAVTSNFVAKMTPKEWVISGFLKYVFSALYNNGVNYLSIKQTTGIQNLDASSYLNEKFCIPQKEEQYEIAKFLDNKTTQINEAIAIKQKQIELLKERKQIIIQQAVTQGLNPDATMKYSGGDWIGAIPGHWIVKRAKYLLDEINERSETGLEELLSVSHMTGVTPRSEKNVTMFMAEDYTGSKLCHSGDLVINIMWAWMGALGVSDRTGIVSPSYGVFREQREGTFVPKYLEMLLKSTKYVEYYNKVSTGLHSSRLRFYGHMLFDMALGFPPYEEQTQIVEYISRECSKVDEAITVQAEQVSKLKEYKTTLINSAVTGKIKVTELA